MSITFRNPDGSLWRLPGPEEERKLYRARKPKAGKKKRPIKNHERDTKEEKLLIKALQRLAKRFRAMDPTNGYAKELDKFAKMMQNDLNEYYRE